MAALFSSDRDGWGVGVKYKETGRRDKDKRTRIHNRKKILYAACLGKS
jgi:hypothetical protein